MEIHMKLDQQLLVLRVLYKKIRLWSHRLGKTSYMAVLNTYSFFCSPETLTVRLPPLNSQANSRTNSRLQCQVFRAYLNNMPNYTFQLQLLIEPDRHVLQSIEQSLADLSHPSALLHSCQFFNTVLIHDFPPEIFLQRPKIIFVSYFYCNYSVILCFIPIIVFRNFIIYLIVDLHELPMQYWIVYMI